MGRVRRVALLGEDGPGGDPAGSATHHLDDAARAVVRGHGADVEADLHDGGAVVFDDRSVARAVVGVRQIVVDRLGHAVDAHVITALDGLLVDLVGGVLRIVATGVEEVADVVRGEDLEEAVHVLRGLGGLLLEVELVATGAERRRRRVPQAFDRLGLLVVQVDEVLVEDAVDAVEPTVDVLDEIVASGLGDDAGDGGIDDRGGAAGLGDEQVADEFSHRFFPFENRPEPCPAPEARSKAGLAEAWRRPRRSRSGRQGGPSRLPGRMEPP